MSAAALFGLLLGLFLLHTPIAIAIGTASVIAFWVSADTSLMLAVQRMYAGADSFPLMAVPLFMLAGLLLEAGGLSRRIVDVAHSLVGWLPGGLAAVSVVSAMFFAGISGSAAADTAAVGGILVPAMLRAGYDRPFSAAVQAAGGSIGVIIPPSIPMIIFGVLTGASIGQLFLAGLLPGLLMGVSLIAVIVWQCRGMEQTHTAFSWKHVRQSLRRAWLALGAPLVILGGILGGVFTATESAAVAVAYGFVVGTVGYKELPLRDLPKLCLEAGVIASVVMFIIAQATAFSWFMTVQELPARIADMLLSLTQDPVLLLLLVNAVLLVAGTLIETTAALLLFVPVLVPLLPVLGMDPIQFGVLMVMNLAIGMLTPPLGICLVVASGIAAAPLERVSRACLSFVLILVADLLLVAFFPPLTQWLPALLD